MYGAVKLLESVLSPAEQITNSFLSPDSSCFLKNDKYVRLHLVQRSFGLISRDVGAYIDDEGFERFISVREMNRSLSAPDLSLITALYLKWRDQREVVPIVDTFAVPVIDYVPGASAPSYASRNNYGVFVYKDANGLLCSHYKGVHSYFKEECEYSLRVTPKRGNDVYCYLIQKKFDDEFLQKEPIVFFDPAWGEKKTNMLYLTGTVDPSRHDLGISWLHFGEYWNSFITGVRKKYEGEVSHIRAWQSQNNGYPHFHALVYFKNHEFTAVRWVDNDGRVSFRLPSRSSDRQKIKDCWTHGNLDVSCVSDTHTAFKDLLKYILRDLEGGESDLTNAMVWFFGKQSFGLSSKFKDLFGTGSGASLEPSDADLINADIGNSNRLLLRIDVFPVIGADLVPPTWQMLLSGSDPPPELVCFFEVLKLHCEAVESKHKRDDGVPVFLWREVVRR